MILNNKPPIIPQLSSPIDTRYFPSVKDDGYIEKLEREGEISEKSKKREEVLFEDFDSISRNAPAIPGEEI